MRRGAAAALLGLVLLLWGCSSRPSGVLPPGRMAALLADIEMGQSVVEEEGNVYASDSARRTLRAAICRRHSTDAAGLDSSLAWYASHPDKYVEVLDLTVKRLEESLAEARSSSMLALRSGGDDLFGGPEAVSADGDSVDIWPLLPAYRFTSASPRTVIAFEQRRDRNAEPGDIYELRFRLTTAGRAAGLKAAASMAATYHRATIQADAQAATVMPAPREAGSSRPVTLRMYTDSASTVSSLFGAITLTGLPSDGTPVYVDSIALVRMRLKAGR